MVDAISSAGLASAAAKSSAQSLSGNFDTFLKLLTTQLQNQDPLAPTDTAAFTNQLVQYSQVEQQIKANDKLASLVSLQGNIQTQAALSYIGLDVKTASNDFNYAGDNATYKIDYNLASLANKAQVGILDEKGSLVKTINVDPTTGDHTVAWDGTDDNGNAVAAGKYTLAIGALAADGSSVVSKAYVTNRVTGVENAADGTLQLKMGKISTTLGNVLSANLPNMNI